MNKLILVGNGFDLAHGLPTSYTDFLNNFWKTLHLNRKEDYIKEIIENDESYFEFLNYGGNIINSFDDLIDNLESYCKEYGFNFNKKEASANHNFRVIFKFKNDFFKKVNQKKSLKNWVDIENEYYSELKKITKIPKLDISKSNDLHLKEKKEKVIILNKEFGKVKELLIKYLKENIIQKFDLEAFENNAKFLEMYNIFKPNSSLNGNKWNEREFASSSDYEHIRDVNEGEVLTKKIFCSSYIVNFNYTDSSYLYYKETDKEGFFENSNINSIHGEIDAKDFETVFGYGDEIDEDYKLIENLDDNEYLKYFKSFQYFQNRCYDNLLNFIDNEKFQVCILGHSCGLSDRIMLNTIFEHKNCRSIKVYYHQKENGTDNYLDIVQNISRHFKDKPMMRRKIVNKEYSSPLPQNVRFKKIEKNQ